MRNLDACMVVSCVASVQSCWCHGDGRQTAEVSCKRLQERAEESQEMISRQTAQLLDDKRKLLKDLGE